MARRLPRAFADAVDADAFDGCCEGEGFSSLARLESVALSFVVVVFDARLDLDETSRGVSFETQEGSVVADLPRLRNKYYARVPGDLPRYSRRRRGR